MTTNNTTGQRIRYLMIHCTATPEGRWVDGSEIIRWHTSPAPKGKGWKRPGYTDVIHLDGTVERLVPNNEDEVVDAWEITNGAVGMNACTRHVVYVGGTDAKGRPKDTRTAAQLQSMRTYVEDFLQRFPFAKVVGHNEFSAKACPCFDVQAWQSEQ